MGEQREFFHVLVSGASLAFGIPFLGGEVLALLCKGPEIKPIFFWLVVGLHLVGGVAGGVLVATRWPMGGWRSLAATGLLAYLLQQALSLLFYGSSALGDPLPLVTLLGGCLLGGGLRGLSMHGGGP